MAGLNLIKNNTLPFNIGDIVVVGNWRGSIEANISEIVHINKGRDSEFIKIRFDDIFLYSENIFKRNGEYSSEKVLKKMYHVNFGQPCKNDIVTLINSNEKVKIIRKWKNYLNVFTAIKSDSSLIHITSYDTIEYNPIYKKNNILKWF